MHTQEYAGKLINELLFAAQKTKSNIKDPVLGLSANDPMQKVISKYLLPHLMDDEDPTNTVKALLIYANKFERLGYVTPSDMYNVIYLVKRDEAVELVWIMLGKSPRSLPDAKSFLGGSLERPAGISDHDWL